MDRRSLLKGAAGLALAGTALMGPGAPIAQGAAAARRVRPGDPGWPTAEEWAHLKAAVGGRLQPVEPPLAASVRGLGADADPLEALANPFAIQDLAGATQTVGWVDGWTTAPSVYAVEPESAAEVAAAVTFAREKNLRLVVKGGAHSYLGQSNAADSLLIWTRRLNRIELHDAFVPKGGEGRIAPQPAVSVGSGSRFIELYTAVVTDAGRFVQGGGCTSVGVGGHVQTGGFGSFSKYGGLVAASLLEAEIVTADGAVRTVNALSDPDLFLALKGGGAGFGITTRLTLATRDLPERAGFLGRTITARDEAAFVRLAEAFFAFAAQALINPHWGEQVAFSPDNRLEIAMVFQGLSDDEVEAAWAPFWQWVEEHAADIADPGVTRLVSMPARHWWDHAYRKAHLPNSIVEDVRPGGRPGWFWWAGNTSEVGVFLSGYESLWMPERLLSPEERGRLAATTVAASRSFAVTFHFNKGLAGATDARRAEAREAAIHPSALDAFALLLIAGGQTKVHPGLAGREPDLDRARAEGRRIADAFARMRALAPEAGSYSSEMSYHEPNWQASAWGPHYPRLQAVKAKYDPTGLFTGHHQVGSEAWDKDGFERSG